MTESAPGFDLSTTTPRAAATRDLPTMLAAVSAQRLQLEQLAAGGVEVDAQLTGLRLVEVHLPALVQYATQLEGIAAGLSILKSPPDLSEPMTAMAAALQRLGDVLALQQPPAATG